MIEIREGKQMKQVFNVLDKNYTEEIIDLILTNYITMLRVFFISTKRNSVLVKILTKNFV